MDDVFLTDDQWNQSVLAKEPSWMGLTASYLRNYKRFKEESGCGLMPNHERIIRATEALYWQCDEADRAIMDGTFEGSRREKKYRFFRLSCLLAIRAGLCTACVVPAEWEKLELEIKEGDETDEFS